MVAPFSCVFGGILSPVFAVFVFVGGVVVFVVVCFCGFSALFLRFPAVRVCFLVCVAFVRFWLVFCVVFVLVNVATVAGITAPPFCLSSVDGSGRKNPKKEKARRARFGFVVLSSQWFKSFLFVFFFVLRGYSDSGENAPRVFFFFFGW